MLKDVLSGIILPSQQFRDSAYLTGSHPSIPWIGTDKNGKTFLAICKGILRDSNNKAYGLAPWDIGIVDSQNDYITQLLTEKTWSNPSTGKMPFLDGVPRFPLLIDYSESQPPGEWKLPLITKSDYLIFNDDGSISRNTNNICECSITGPFPGSPIGDLPSGIDWKANFKRGSLDGVTFPVMERKIFREKFGPIRWEQWLLQEGTYVLVNSSDTNRIVKTTEHVGLKPIQNIFPWNI